MGYALLWIESLAASLLLVAVATAYSERARMKLAAGVLLVLAVAAPTLIGGAETAFAGLMCSMRIEHHWLAYTVSWLVCLVAGIVAVLWRGLRRHDGVRPAAAWPTAKLAVGFAVALALHFITFWNMDTTMRLQLSSVRMEAGAMAVAAAPPRPPDAENAAFVYEKAFALLKRTNEQDPHWKAVYEKKSGTWYKDFNKAGFNCADPELREFLKAHQPTLVLLKRAAAMSGCYFEHDYAQPSLDMQLPELAKMRGCARLLAADARCKAADGQVYAALENVAAARAISRHVGSEPMLISGLVCVAADSIALDALEGILTTTTPSGAELAALPHDETVSFQRVLRRSLTGEEAFGLSAFAMLGGDTTPDYMSQELGLDKSFLAPALIVQWRVFLLPDDLAGYRKHLRAMRDAARLSFKDAQSKVSELSRDGEIRRAGILSSYVLPALSRAYRTFARAEARHRLAEVAVAVASSRAKTGQFPAKLESLVPDYLAEVPLDPFDEKPLRMVTSATGVTLYSIGEDLVDDGGAIPMDPGTGKGDIIFRVGSAPDQPAKSQ